MAAESIMCDMDDELARRDLAKHSVQRVRVHWSCEKFHEASILRHENYFLDQLGPCLSKRE